MKALTVLLSALLIGCLACCSSDKPIQSKKEPPRPLTVSERKVVEASGGFAYNFFREMAAYQDTGNLFVSPLSVSLALGMTLNGTAGETRTAIEQTLDLGGMSSEEINQSYMSLMNLLTTMDPTVTFEIANSIWTRLGFPVKQSFYDVNREFFESEVRELDFDYDWAADTINGWVARKTHDRIDSIVDKPIDPSTVMFLINAIYFYGDWTYQFDQTHTRDAQFNLVDGSQTPCRMMAQTATVPYLVTDQFRMATLPYGDGYFNMAIILPDETVSINDFIAGFAEESFNAWLDQSHATEIDLFLPKFTLEWGSSLKDVLKAMGMAIAFGGAADFSELTDSADLYISDVRQKTFVKVDEEGTEAAAVTVVDIRVTSAEPTTMRLDRPFVCVIYDNHTGSILFIGRIMNPGYAG
ncbi:MAG: serpin family protein [bacterium]